MNNFRIWVRDEYRGLLKAEDIEVAIVVARQWSAASSSDLVRVEPSQIPSVISPIDIELRKHLKGA